MSRDVRTTLAIMAIALMVGAPLIFAAPGGANTNYLAMVMHIVPPTPIPTPVPPAMESLVIQLSEMRSGYVRDTWQPISNADAAKSYRDPKAAAAAFIAQGRETSWNVLYSSRDYPFSDALVVGNQLFRYLTPDGAVAGQAYTLAEAQRDRPDYRPFNVSTPCCPTVGLRRTFKSGTTNLDQFLVSVRVGRYVTNVQVGGISGSITVSRVIYYAQLAINHLVDVPQVMHAVDSPAPASAPHIDTIDASFTPR